MLTMLRSKKSNVFGWALMILLIVGLVGFGFTDLLRGSRGNVLATVGEQEVTADQYAGLFRLQQNAVSQQIGRRVTGEEIIQAGLSQDYLQSLIEQAAWGSEAAQLGLSLPDETLQETILRNPEFAGIAGSFDQAVYDEAVRRSGLNPVAFEDQLRNGAMRDVIMALAISDISMVPAFTKDLVSYVSEEREIDYFTLGYADYLPQTAPSEDDLLAFYDANPELFTRAEARNISYIALDPVKIARETDIDEAILREEYAARAADYIQPESRDVARIVYVSDAEAEAAKAALLDGNLTLEAIAAERGVTADDLTTTGVTATDLPGSIPAEHGDAIFNAETVTAPLPTAFGPAIYVVRAVNAGSTIEFETVRDQLRLEIALRQVRDSALTDITLAEELIAGGASYEEIASESRFEVLETTITREGGPGFGILPSFVEEGFTADLNEDRDLIETQSGRSFALRVTEIIEAHVPPLAEITDQVTEAWRTDAARKAATIAAEGMIARAGEGQTLQSLATAEGSAFLRHDPLVRGAPSDVISPEMLETFFDGDIGTLAQGATDTGIVVAQLAQITPFDDTTPDNKALLDGIQAQLSVALRRDTAKAIASTITQRDGVEINAALVSAVNAQLQQ